LQLKIVYTYTYRSPIASAIENHENMYVSNFESAGFEEVNLDYLVDLDNHEVSEAAIQAQIARIE
jgi:hypothetical protein